MPALLARAIECDQRLSRDIDADRGALMRCIEDCTARALRLNDTLPVTWLLRASALIHAGQWKASLEASARSIALEPYSSALLVHRAALILACGEPDDALSVLAEAGAQVRQPTAAQKQTECEAHLLRGRYFDAIEAGERSLGLGSSDDFDTHLYLVAANQNVGDAAKALHAMEAVLRVQPRYTIAIHRSLRPSQHPRYLALLDEHIYPALREAGSREA